MCGFTKNKNNMSNILPHQQRVIDEKLELDGKIKALQAFVEGTNSPFNELSCDDRSDLISQLYTMERYTGILQRRINRFP